MAQIENVPVTMGKMIHVENTDENRKYNELPIYVAVWVEDAESNEKKCLLFTDGEIERATKRALKNPEDHTKLTPAKKGWLSRIFGL